MFTFRHPWNETIHNNTMAFVDPSQYGQMVRQLPFTVPFIVLSVIGIIGNGHTLYILRRYYGAFSSYKLILTYLVICDLCGCVGMISKEIGERIRYPVRYIEQYGKEFCIIPHYFGYFGSQWSMWFIVLISYDRYRAVCFPFSVSLSKKTINLVTIGMGFLCLCSSVPVLFLYGIRSFSIPSFQNGTECGIKDTLKSSYVPVIYFLILEAMTFVTFFFVSMFYYKIWREVHKAKQIQKDLLQVTYSKDKQSDVALKSTRKSEEISSKIVSIDSPDPVEKKYTTEKESLATLSHNPDDSSRMVFPHNAKFMPVEKTEGSKCIALKSSHTDDRLHLSLNNPQSSMEEDAAIVPIGDIKVLQEQDQVKENRNKGGVTVSQKRNTQNKFKEKKDQNLKLMIIALTITIMFFVSYNTMLVSMVIQSWPTTKRAISQEELIAFRCLFNVIFMNNILNPVVYFLNDPRFLQGLREMYKCT